MANHNGYSLFVSAAHPTANTAAAFAALTWTEVEGHQQLPQLGFTHNMIDVPDLKDGIILGEKGAGQGVDTTVMCRHIENASGYTDPGQVIIRTASDDDDGILSYKLAQGSGTNNAVETGDPVIYAQGIAHSLRDNQGTTSSFEGFEAGFRQNAKTVTGTEPA